MFNIFKRKRAIPERDLDFFDDDMNFASMIDEPDAASRSPVMTVGKGVLSGVKDAILSPNTILNVINKTLGDEFDAPFASAKELYTDVGRARREILTDLTRTQLEAKRVLGGGLDLSEEQLPPTLAKKLRGIVGTESKSTETAGQLRPEKSDSDPAQDMMLGLQEINRKESRKRNQQESLREYSRDIRSRQDTRVQLKFLEDISKHTSFTSEYHKKFDASYKQKMLEISLKTYGILGQTYQLQAKASADIITELKSITKNTSLPDFVKRNNKERLLEISRENIMESFLGGIYDKRQNFFKTFGSNLKDSFQEKTGQFLGGVRDGLGTIDELTGELSLARAMTDGMSKSDKLGMAGNMVGSTLAGWGGGKLGQDLNRRFGGNDKFNRFRNSALMGYENIPQYLTKMLEQEYDYNKSDDLLYNVKYGAKSVLGGAMDRFNSNRTSVDLSGKNLSFEDLERNAMIAHTHVTPTLLSFILSEIKYGTRGVESDPLVFDYGTNRFTTGRGLQDKVMSALFSDGKKSTEKYKEENLFKTIDPTGQLNESQRQDLYRQLMTMNMSGNQAADRNFFLNRDSFTGENADNYNALFANYLGQDKDRKRERGLNRSVQQLGNSFNISRTELESIINNGGLFALIESGLLDESGILNQSAVMNTFMGGGIGPFVGPMPRVQGQGAGLWNRQSTRSNLEDVFKSSSGSSFADAPSLSGQGITYQGQPNRDLLEEMLTVIKSIDSNLQTGVSTVNIDMDPQQLADFLRAKKAGLGSWVKTGMSGAFGALTKVSKALSGGGQRILSNLGKVAKLPFYPFLRKHKDRLELWIEGELLPRLNQKGLEAGQYIDATTGKVIKKWEDIKGDVKDIDTGDILVYAAEIKNLKAKETITGVFKSIGSILKIPMNILMGGARGLQGAAQGVSHALTSLTKTSYSIAKGLIWNAQDVYVNGETSPRLLAIMMKSGAYFSQVTSKIIRTPFDIDGPVVDREGNVHLSLEDLKTGIVGKDGKPIENRITRVIKGSFGLLVRGFNRAKELTKAIAKKVGGGISGVFKGVKRFIRRDAGKSSDEGAATGTGETNLWLEGIYDLLDERLKKPKHTRLNSFTDMKAKAKGIFSDREGEGRGGDDEYGDDEDDGSGGGILRRLGRGITGIFKRLGSGLKALFVGKDGKGGLKGVLGKLAGGASSVLGNAGRTGAGFFAKAAATAGAGAAAIKIAAVATVAAIGGWFIYKTIGVKDISKLTGWRMLQYGFKDNSAQDISKIISLEASVKKFVTWNGDQAVGLNITGDGQELYDAFGVSATNDGEVARLTRWFNLRFVPIYCAHLSSLKRVEANPNLESIDKLSEENKSIYYQGVSFDHNVLRILDNPFGGWFSGNTLKVTSAEVREYSAMVAALLNQGKSHLGKKEYRWYDIMFPPAAIVKTVQNLSTDAQIARAIDTEKDRLHDERDRANVQRITGSNPEIPKDEEISAIEAYRFYLYGLKELEEDKVLNVWQMERKLREYTKFDGDGQAKLELSPQLITNMFVSTFIGSSWDEVFRKWVQGRFIPVWLCYCTLCAKYSKTYDSVESAQSGVKKTDYYKLAMIMGSTLDNIWRVTSSPWSGYELSTDPAGGDKYAQILRTYMLTKKIGVQDSGAAKSPGSLDVSGGQTVRGRDGSVRSETGSTPSSGSSSGGVITSLNDRSRILNTDINGLTGAADLYGAGSIVRISSGTSGIGLSHIPMPSGSGTWDAVKLTLAAVAKASGVDLLFLGQVAYAESTFNQKVGTSRSTAKGMGQIINAMWPRITNKYGAKYGITSAISPLDPRANMLMVAELAKEHYNAIKRINPEPTNVDLYLYHFLGSPAGAKMLKANPNAIASHVCPEGVGANPEVFIDKGVHRTVMGLIGHITTRLAQATALIKITDDLLNYRLVDGVSPGIAGTGTNATDGPGGGYTLPTGDQSNNTINFGGNDYSGMDAINVSGSAPEYSGNIGNFGTGTSIETGIEGASIIDAKGGLIQISVARGPSTPDGTFGTMTLPNGMKFITLELPWKNNKNRVSCIPIGSYKAWANSNSTPAKNAGIPFAYHLDGVPGRRGIQIHSGGYGGDVSLGKKSNIEGCILLGSKVVPGENGQRGFNRNDSKACIIAFNSALNRQRIMVTITGESAEVGANDQGVGSVAPVGANVPDYTNVSTGAQSGVTESGTVQDPSVQGNKATPSAAAQSLSSNGELMNQLLEVNKKISADGQATVEALGLLGQLLAKIAQTSGEGNQIQQQLVANTKGDDMEAVVNTSSKW